MKAWPHTHIGIARDEVGLFIGTRFLQTGNRYKTLIEQVTTAYPDADSVIIIPLEPAIRWEQVVVTREVKVEEWVEKRDDY